MALEVVGIEFVSSTRSSWADPPGSEGTPFTLLGKQKQ